LTLSVFSAQNTFSFLLLSIIRTALIQKKKLVFTGLHLHKITDSGTVVEIEIKEWYSVVEEEWIFFGF
jgi:hypothetical protein